MSALSNCRSVLPPPLRGRVGEGGSHTATLVMLPPPSLSLPRKGGGDDNREAAP